MYLEIYCGSTKLPSPIAISSSGELIWSANTGRSTTGTMIGDIIAAKNTFTIDWGILNATEVSTIEQNLPTVNSPFKTFSIKTNSGTVIASITGYRSNISKTLLPICTDGKVWYSGVSTEIIEQ